MLTLSLCASHLDFARKTLDLRALDIAQTNDFNQLKLDARNQLQLPSVIFADQFKFTYLGFF
jgi:hypothetical protein